MAKQPPVKSKYKGSTRRDLSRARSLGLRLLVGGIALAFVVILLLAFLVATGEITLR